MEVTAISRFVRISPRKARSLAAAIRGLPVAEALKIVQFSERKAATLIGKVIRSAVANAENNHDLSADGLRVERATVDPGPSFKRFVPRARGSAGPVMKRTSHIRITLTDGKTKG